MASLVAAIVTMRGEFFAVSLALVAALRRAVCTFLRRRVFFEAGRLVVLRPREFLRCGDDSNTWQAVFLSWPEEALRDVTSTTHVGGPGDPLVSVLASVF